MHRFSPIGDTFLTLLGLFSVIAGGTMLRLVPAGLCGFLVLWGLVLLGYEFAKIFIFLRELSERRPGGPKGRERIPRSGDYLVGKGGPEVVVPFPPRAA